MDCGGLDPLNQSSVDPEKLALELPAKLVGQMRLHVTAAAPLEACGLVAGQPGRGVAVFPITNELHSPVRYRMDPHEQLAAFLIRMGRPRHHRLTSPRRITRRWRT
jgi:hypothetical protein